MAEPFSLISLAFQQGGEINPRYTCEGDDISPPLQWENIPSGTKSLALVLEDPDAPNPEAPRTIWTHWILYNIPPETMDLDEGMSELPPGARPGLNDWEEANYGGPCPRIGRHRYFFRLYALDRMLPDLNLPTRSELLQAMQGHILAEASLMGLYQKQELDIRALQDDNTDSRNP